LYLDCCGGCWEGPWTAGEAVPVVIHLDMAVADLPAARG